MHPDAPRTPEMGGGEGGRVLFVSSHPLDELRSRFARATDAGWGADFADPDHASRLLNGADRWDAMVVDAGCPRAEASLLEAERLRPLIPRLSLARANDHVSARLAWGVLGAIPRGAAWSTIEELLLRARRLHVRIGPAVSAVIGDLNRLPSVPQAYWDLRAATLRDDVNMGEIADIVATDPSLSLRVLSLVNSASFGLRTPVSSIRQAATLLGLNLIRGLLLSAHAFSLFSPRDRDFSILAFQAHALATARLAATLGADLGVADDAFTAGVLHDVGSLVIAVCLHDESMAARSRAAVEKRSVSLVEAELLGTTHAEIGAGLLSRWGLPLSIVEAVANHHAKEKLVAGSAPVLAVLHVAESVLDEHGDVQLDVAFLERQGLSAHLERWQSHADSAVGSRQGRGEPRGGVSP
jgi:HD-like signal output (HDOD) protein